MPLELYDLYRNIVFATNYNFHRIRPDEIVRGQRVFVVGIYQGFNPCVSPASVGISIIIDRLEHKAVNGVVGDYVYFFYNEGGAKGQESFVPLEQLIGEDYLSLYLVAD